MAEIRFGCEHCGQEVAVDESLAGRRGKCPNPECRQVLTIPAAASPPPPDPPAREARVSEFVYKVVPLAPLIEADRKRSFGVQAAEHLEQVISQWAERGWDFHRIDSMSVEEPPGCLALLFGGRSSIVRFHAVTLRRRR